jgi:hypothetical protein
MEGCVHVINKYNTILYKGLVHLQILVCEWFLITYQQTAVLIILKPQDSRRYL